MNNFLMFHKLTPLHEAVLKGDKQTALHLLETGAALLQDDHGCTPLHLAALLEDKGMLELLLKGADPSVQRLRNHNLDTYEDILRMLTFPPVYPPDQIVCHVKRGDALQAITALQFKELTGTTYCDHLLATKEKLLKKWITLTIDVNEDLAAKVDAFYEKPPLLYMEEESGWGLKAGEVLKPHQILCCYAGELDADIPSSPYRLVGIEPVRYGNEASRANDGFPNTKPSSREYTRYLETIEEIQPGEGIYFDYMVKHPVKWGRYAFYRLKEMEEYASHYTDDKVKCCYIFNTPSAIIHLALRNLISCEELFQKPFDELSNLFHWGQSREAKALYTYIQATFKLLAYLKEHPLRQEVIEHFDQALFQHPVVSVLQTLLIASFNPDKFLSSQGAWNEFKAWSLAVMTIEEEILFSEHPDLQKHKNSLAWPPFQEMLREAASLALSNERSREIILLLGKRECT